MWFSFNINKARTASYNNYAIGKFLVSESYSCFADVKVRLRNAIYIYSDNPEKLEEQINQMEEYKLKEEQNFADFETRLPSLGSDIESQYHELDDRMNAYIATADSIIALVKEGKNCRGSGRTYRQWRGCGRRSGREFNDADGYYGAGGRGEQQPGR